MAAAAAGNQVHNVFVYGSLLADDVVRALLSRIPQSSPAILNGYHRFSIKGRVYPAILPVENKKVSGKVLHGITDPELYILDEFEDVDQYERVAVDVFLMVAATGIGLGSKRFKRREMLEHESRAMSSIFAFSK